MSEQHSSATQRMPTTAEIVRQFVERMNSGGSQTFPLFGEHLEWIEVHSGRRGGRQELFAAMGESRAQFESVSFEPVSTIVEGDNAALEGQWSATIISTGRRITVSLVFMLSVRDGRIVREIDYVIMPPDLLKGLSE